MYYPLEVLNDKEFEELSKDLLERELGISFQIFTSGRDKGIDLRYAWSKENQIIVQAKRYIKTTFPKLKAEMLKEKVKMDKLAVRPERYILTTSLPLSVGQTDELFQLLKPYIQSTQDIYGADRMTGMISKYSAIEEKYYKLWIASTTVLSRILNNAVSGRSTFYQEKILAKVSHYVPTTNFQLAINKLKEHHFLIVSGEPGIGKTTISYLLICDLMANGYQLIYVDDKLQDAEQLLSPSPDVKQVVFFDDFFGANLSEIMHPRNTESKIVGFIERIQASPNKFLVLTTRTTILKQAQHRFENFNRSGLADLSKYELKLQSYSKLDRAKILYNHLFYSGMATAQFEVFFEEKNYLKIINHKNYFPRLIEFITSVNRLKNIEPAATEKFIFDSLDNPKEIWQFAYDEQLKPEDQFLLMTLFSLGGSHIPSEQLEIAFDHRYAYEIEHNGFVLKSDAYAISLKKLMDGFVSNEINDQDGSINFSFLNPSIADFFLHYLRTRPKEQERVLYSAVFFKQITTYFTPGITNGLIFPANKKYEFFNRYQVILPALLENADDESAAGVTALYTYLRFFGDLVTESEVLPLFRGIEFNYMSTVNLMELNYVLSGLIEYEDMKEYVAEHWKNIFSGAFELAQDSSDFSTILSLMEDYDIYQSTWSTDESFTRTLGSAVNCCYAKFDVDVSSSESEILSALNEGYEGDAYGIIENIITDDYAQFLSDCELSDFYEKFIISADFNPQSYLDSIIENHSHYDDHDDYRSHMGSGEDYRPVDENTAIERLFER